MSVAQILASLQAQMGSIVPPYDKLDIQTRVAQLLYDGLQIGVADASLAQPMEIGESLESVIGPGLGPALASTSIVTVTSIPLAAGDYDVSGMGCINAVGAVTGSYWVAAIGTSTGLGTAGDNRIQTSVFPTAALGAVAFAISAMPVHIPPGGGNIYLVMQAVYSAGTSVTGSGRISVRRAR